jgi:L1 cell adhesion molecule like protein
MWRRFAAQVLAVAGTSWVGGRDFDFRLLDFCADEFRHRSQGADVRQHPAAMARLLAACERAKK